MRRCAIASRRSDTCLVMSSSRRRSRDRDGAWTGSARVDGRVKRSGGEIRRIASRLRLACARHAATHRWRHMVRRNRELDELIRIGVALMNEHDRSVLLHKILEAGKRFTESDGGGLILTERREGEAPVLRLALYEFDSLPDLPDITGRTLPIDNSSIVGHAALTGRPSSSPMPTSFRPTPASGTTRNSTDSTGIAAVRCWSCRWSISSATASAFSSS